MLPRGGGGGSARGGGQTGETPSGNQQVDNLKRQVENLKRQLTNKGGNSAPPPPQAPGARAAAPTKKARNRGNRVPGDLDGMARNDPQSRPICFGYNLGSCSQQCKDGKCPKGLHVCGGCFSPGCQYVTCPRKGKHQ